MTETERQEKINQAKDIIATMLSWDCNGLKCSVDCPFYIPADPAGCMVIRANSLWNKINKGEAYGKN